MKFPRKKSADKIDRSVLSILASDDVRFAIENAIANIPGICSQVKVSDDTIENAGHLVNGSADIVILEIDLSDPRALLAIEKLNSYVGISGSLIVVAQYPDIKQVRHLFKMGVSDVLQTPLSQEDVYSSIKSALKTKKTNVARFTAGRVISVMKCGGGVGATMLATNLGYTISTRFKGKSENAPKTLIIDLDVQFGNVGTILNKDGKTDLVDLLRAADRLDGAMVAAAVQPITENLGIISSSKSIIPLSALTPEFLEKLIELAKSMFDYIILDHPGAWFGATAKSTQLSDIIIPVMLSNVEHVTNAKRVLEGLENLNVTASKSLFFINRVAKGLNAKDRINSINGITKRPSFLFYDNPKLHQQARDQGLLLHKVSGSSSEQKLMKKFVDQVFAHLNSVDETDFPTAVQSTPPATLSLGY